MKKIIGFIGIIATMLSMTLTVFAGDVPEELLSNDQAQVFFGEVVSYEPDGEISSIEVIPTKKIMGDVIVDGSCATWQNVNPVGNFNVTVGKQYLFTWSDINNPICIFEVTDFDTKTLKLKNTTGDMWERFEEYLNDGKYEKAEQDRLNNLKFNKQQKAQMFSELFEVNRSEIEKIEKIEVVYPSEGDPVGCYVDVDDFFDIAEKTLLTPTNEPSNLDADGIWIIACDKDENRHSVWLDEYARVDKEANMSSSVITTGYSIGNEDFIKICDFLPKEATAHISIDNPSNVSVAVFIGIVILVFAAAFITGIVIKKKKH